MSMPLLKRLGSNPALGGGRPGKYPMLSWAKLYREFLEILDDRQGQGSPIPVSKWHDLIGDPTVEK
jgi:hypothetical protein